MGELSIWEKLKCLIGSIGWRLYIWGLHGADEEGWHYYRDLEAFGFHEIEAPKTLTERFNQHLRDKASERYKKRF